MICFVVRGTEKEIDPVYMEVREMTTEACVCVHICACENCFCNEMALKGIKILGNKASKVDVISRCVRGGELPRIIESQNG